MELGTGTGFALGRDSELKAIGARFVPAQGIMPTDLAPRAGSRPATAKPDRRASVREVTIPDLRRAYVVRWGQLVPHLYFWKSAKWVRGLRLAATDEPGLW